jgi:hypothetical protein
LEATSFQFLDQYENVVPFENPASYHLYPPMPLPQPQPQPGTQTKFNPTKRNAILPQPNTMVFGTPWDDSSSRKTDDTTMNPTWNKGARVAGIAGITGVTIVAWPLALGALGWTAGGIAAGMIFLSACLEQSC